MVAPARGVANGPKTGHSPRHVLWFVLSEGLRVGHTVHRGKQESCLPRKGSSSDPYCTGPRCRERPAYLATTQVNLYERV